MKIRIIAVGRNGSGPVYELTTDYMRRAKITGKSIGVNKIEIIEIDDKGQTLILMSLTAPGCPVAEEMPGWVSEAVEPVPGVKSVKVEIVWEPQWGMDMMSDEARLELGFM